MARKLTTTLAVGLCSLRTHTAFAFQKPSSPIYLQQQRCNQHLLAPTTIRSSMSTSTKNDEEIPFHFGPFAISRDHVFYTTSLSAAFVNLRPIVPGHVLIMPLRVVPLLSDLTADEYADLWHTVRVVQQDILQKHYPECEAFNIAVQDGPAAGQTVPHVHVHILPRQAGDYERNDDVYTEIEQWAPRDELRPKSVALDVPEDKDRQDRTTEQMAQEAALYRNLSVIPKL